MVDFNSREKIQTYGNRHSILRSVEEKYYRLWSLEGVKSVASKGFVKVRHRSWEGSVVGIDENTNSYIVNLHVGKWIQKLYVKVMDENSSREKVLSQIEMIISPGSKKSIAS